MRFSLLLVIPVILNCAGEHGRRTSGESAPQFAVPFDSLVGSIQPPAPPDYKTLGGMLLDGPDTTRWGMELLVRDSIRYLTLDSLDHYSNGKPNWRVVAATALPPLGPKEEFVWVDCAFDGKSDASIATLGVWRDTTLTQIRYAVRPHVPSRRFELLPSERVSCDVERDRS